MNCIQKRRLVAVKAAALDKILESRKNLLVRFAGEDEATRSDIKKDAAATIFTAVEDAYLDVSNWKALNGGE